MEVDPSGLNGLFVFGPDHKSGNKAWGIIARQYAQLYMKATGSAATTVMITNLHDLQQAFRATKNIDTFCFVGHAGVPGSYPGSAHNPPSPAPDSYLFLESEGIVGSSDIAACQIRTLSNTNVNDKAFFFLYGCGTAATRNQPRLGEFEGPGLRTGQPTMAKSFASKLGSPVWGFAPHVTPGGRPFFPRGFTWHNFLGVQNFHNFGDDIFPVRTDP